MREFYKLWACPVNNCPGWTDSRTHTTPKCLTHNAVMVEVVVRRVHRPVEGAREPTLKERLHGILRGER